MILATSQMEKGLQQAHNLYIDIVFHQYRQLVFSFLAIISVILICSHLLKVLWKKTLEDKDFAEGRWILLDFIGMVYCYLFCQVIIASLIPKSAWYPYLVFWLGNGCFCFCILIWTVKYREQSFSVLGLSNWNMRYLIAAIVGYVLFIPFFLSSYVATHILFVCFNMVPQPQEVAKKLLETRGALAVFSILTATIAAPLFEEFIFRVFLYSNFRKIIGIHGAIVISSFIFSISHNNLLAFYPIFSLGVFLAVLYEKSQSVFVPALAHSLHNSITICFLYLSAG